MRRVYANDQLHLEIGLAKTSLVLVCPVAPLCRPAAIALGWPVTFLSIIPRWGGDCGLLHRRSAGWQNEVIVLKHAVLLRPIRIW